MRALVTGGAGFIGSRIVAALVARGDTVRVLHRRSSGLVALEGLPVEHCLGDISDMAAVEQAARGCEAVFHVAGLASYWRSPPREVYRVNVDGTRIVMAACLAARVKRVVFTSSIAAIGIRPGGLPADERTVFDPWSAQFAYADSKHRAEAEVQQAIRQGLDAVIVNPAVVLGAGDHHMISGSMIVELHRGRVPFIPTGGMCAVDADAVAQGHLAAAERGRTGERYILGGENVTYRQAAEMIGEVVGRRPPALAMPRWALGPAAALVDAFNSGRALVSPRPPLVSGEQIRLAGVCYFFDSSKAVAELGYPLLPFRGAVAKAFAWYREHHYL